MEGQPLFLSLAKEEPGLIGEYMQKKIALIELHHHSEVLRTFAQLFLALNWQICILTNEQVRADLYELSGAPILWSLQKKGEKSAAFIQRQQTIVDDCQLAIFVTLVSEFSTLQTPIKSLTPKTILIIHNGNTFFAAPANLSISPTFPQIGKDLAKMIFFYLAGQNRKRQAMLKAFDYLSLAAPSMMDHFYKQQKSSFRNYQYIPPLPFAFFEGLPEARNNSTIRIAIPGTLREEGRDYHKVLHAFQQLAPELETPVQLIFLGGAQSAYAQQLISKFQAIEQEHFKIKYTNQFIAQKDFDAQLRTIDFLILPLTKSYRLGIIREEYGHTNISGGINDMIRFGIPALISGNYPLTPALQQMTAAYDTTADLRDLLLQWLTQKDFQVIRDKAPQLLAPYRKEVVAEAMRTELEAILSQ